MFDYPAELKLIELTRLRLRIEYQQPALFPPGYRLRLRREMRPLAKQLLDQGDFQMLFDPPLPSDPQLQRLIQRPAPGFALQPFLTTEPTSVEEGDEEELEVNFFGHACGLVSGFVNIFEALGKVGLCAGEGRFVLLEVASADLSGVWSTIWRSGRGSGQVAPHLFDLGSWLEETPPVTDRAVLNWRTPLRVMSAGRPLFRPDFAQIFPFLLRRVTGLTASSYGIEWSERAPVWREVAASLQCNISGLRWIDWRELDETAPVPEFGGAVGTMVVEGPGLKNLSWLLTLGTLCNVGKGAAYGAGSYALERDHG